VVSFMPWEIYPKNSPRYPFQNLIGSWVFYVVILICYFRFKGFALYRVFL